MSTAIRAPAVTASPTTRPTTATSDPGLPRPPRGGPSGGRASPPHILRSGERAAPPPPPLTGRPPSTASRRAAHPISDPLFRKAPPVTVKRLTFESPYGCRWCGIEQRRHGRRWFAVIGMHSWLEPDQAMILERMTRRRAHRLAALPPVFHATTDWASDSTGEEGLPYCADCKADACHRWTRIQARLDQQRFGLPRRVRRTRKASVNGGGWGGDQSWPF